MVLKLTADKFYVNESGMNLLLNSPKGELGRQISDLGDKIVNSAKLQVGYRTGKLQRSIHKRHLGNFTGQYLWIGTKVSYALAHHENTRPHVIVPNDPSGKLVFFKGGRMIVTKRVMHPGTKANKFLSQPLIRHFSSL
jgi:hypothetical protein